VVNDVKSNVGMVAERELKLQGVELRFRGPGTGGSEGWGVE